MRPHCYFCGDAQSMCHHWCRQEGVRPHCATFVGMLNESAIISAIEEGMCTHEQFIQSSCKSTTFAGNSLVDMYSKCGSMENTLREFNKMPSCDVIFWNDILGGCHAWTW